MILTKEKGKRMWGNLFSGGNTNGGSGGSGGSGGGGGGSTEWAANAGHADEADHATAADLADEAKALTSNSTDWLKIARKDIAQTIAEAWTFAKGFTSTLKAYFSAGIEVTGDTKTSTLTTTGNATVGGSISASGNVSSGGNVSAYNSVSGNSMTATTSMTAATMIANVFKTVGFTEAVNMIGKGFGVKLDANGLATLQTDNLLVLGQMIVQSLTIREVSYIGGSYMLTPAASQAVMVQPLYTTIPYAPDTRYWTPNGSGDMVGYRLLWLADNGSVGTMNYWKQGDIALCQTFNVTEPGNYTNVQNQYYKRVVCRVGQTNITEGGETKTYHYADLANIAGPRLFDANDQQIQTVDGSYEFNGFLSGSTVPKAGDKVVACGSQADTNRQGCVLISAEGEASIGIYDGIKDYQSLNNYEVHYFSRTAVRMNAEKLTWKTTGTSETQASFMARANSVFLGIGNCGININDESITAKGGKFKMQDDDGNDTFILNENGDLESKGSASFEGTVRAKNLFKTVAVSSGSNSSINDRCEVVTMMNADTNVTWVYVLNNIPESTYGHAFTAGQMLTGQEINELVDNNSRFCWKDDTTNFRIFTGPADEIMLVNKVNYMYLGYTFIPRCQDLAGKEITIRNNTSNTSDAEIRQVDNAQNVFAAGAYVLSPADDYNNIGYGSNLSNHASVPQNKSVTLYSTGSVWLILRTF